MSKTPKTDNYMKVAQWTNQVPVAQTFHFFSESDRASIECAFTAAVDAARTLHPDRRPLDVISVWREPREKGAWWPPSRPTRHERVQLIGHGSALVAPQEEA